MAGRVNLLVWIILGLVLLNGTITYFWLHAALSTPQQPHSGDQSRSWNAHVDRVELRSQLSQISRRWTKNRKRPRRSDGDSVSDIPTLLQKESSVFRIDHMLDNCNANRVPFKSFSEMVQELGLSQTQRYLSVEDFVCLAQCSAQEPELEKVMSIFGIAKFPLVTMYKLCQKQAFPHLVWISDNKVRYKVCSVEKVHAMSVFRDMLKLIFLLAKFVKLPDVVLGFEHQDWATPTNRDPFETQHWVGTFPGIVRLVGVDSHPTLLLPTGSFAVNMGYCGFRSNRVAHMISECDAVTKSAAWEEKKDVILWRGSGTGVPIYPNLVDFVPRVAVTARMLRNGNTNHPNLDIAYAGDKRWTGPMLPHFWEEHAHADAIHKDNHINYKYLLHLDGHTASWSLAHKLRTGSVILWLESHQGFREFYYALLNRWEHYIPVAQDLSNFENVRDWVAGNVLLDKDDEYGDKFARRIRDNVEELVQTRLRREDMWCYMMRMLHSIAGLQVEAPTSNKVEGAGFALDGFVLVDDKYWDGV